jgi:signal transduction histidine kinase
MVIASIILSNRAAYLQSTFSAIIFGLVVIGESSGLIEHYHIGILPSDEVCNLGNPYFFMTFGALVSTLFITTYFTTSIVNELRKGETELEGANRELEVKDKLKSKYVKTVTHDLRSSLSTVQSCLKVVLSGLTGSISEKSRDMIGRAEGRTRKLTHFVEELWSLSRMRVIENFEKKSFSIRAAFTGAKSQLEILLLERDVVLKMEDRADNPLANVNDFLIEDLFINLLDNAIVYSPKGSTITVALEDTAPAGFVQVSIEDGGIGIPEMDLSRVFEDFYRSENARDVYKDGTGLGLSIVKQIIDMHGGNIWVKSRLNCGTTVTFTLPRG